MADESYTDWRGAGGQWPTNPEFVDAPAPLFTTEPYPLSIWRQDDNINLGMPYIVFFPKLERRIAPSPVKQRDIITVYDMLTSAVDLMYTNGLAILDPISATIHEVMNGEWTLTLVHPVDPNQKWKYIRENNIIKCCGQFFTIKRVEWGFPTAKTGTVTATCEHIFYQLADMWIYAQNWGYDLSSNIQCCTFTHCIEAIQKIFASAVTDDTPGTGQRRYAFEYDSDWDFSTPWEVVIDGTGCTPIELFLGANGIVGAKNGELYRDNFYFSINQRMEGAQDKAFDIRIGANLCGIKRTVDTSNVATLYTLFEGHGSGFIAVSYDGQRAFPLFQFPHNITRSDSYSFPDDVFDYAVRNGKTLMQQLAQICFSRWRQYATPTICYDVSIKDVRQKPDYSEITDIPRFKVGDQGRIFDERLGGEITLRITETETDGITGEVTRVVFGSTNSFTRGAAYPNTLTNYAPNIEESTIFMYDSRGRIIVDGNNKILAVRVTL